MKLTRQQLDVLHGIASIGRCNDSTPETVLWLWEHGFIERGYARRLEPTVAGRAALVEAKAEAAAQASLDRISKIRGGK